jgi:hypothetical protein
VVLRRLGPPEPLRFFTEDESAIARALLDRLLGQDDSPALDLLQEIDRRLALDETDGWRYEDMPHDSEAWRRTLQLLDEDARSRFGDGFALLGRSQQAALVQAVQDRIGEPWHELPARHVWSLWTRYACTAFYAHPWAWNEIGFGGPAYPRGYKNLGGREPWERPEHDAHDPVPWAERVEAARRRHLDSLGRAALGR